MGSASPHAPKARSRWLHTVRSITSGRTIHRWGVPSPRSRPSAPRSTSARNRTSLAPGVSVISSISLFTDNNYTLAALANFQGEDYPFAAFSGTSMSSPAVAGIVAMILEADPTITAAEVRALLKATARTDNNTGVIPPGGSTRWGMGKVNAYRAVSELLGVVSVPSMAETNVLLWPNPARSILNISTGRSGVAQVTFMDIAGRVVYTARHADGTRSQWMFSISPAGVYCIRVEQTDRSIVSRWVKQ